jgi:hypothetical protein
MAKKAAKSGGDSWIKCAGYALDLRNNDDNFVIELDVTGADEGEYFLRVKALNDRTGLVQRALHLIADRWPANDWEFQADEGGSITDVR